jgi:hypothetical protein
MLGDMIPRDESESVEIVVEYSLHPSDDVIRVTAKVRRQFEGVVLAKLCSGDDAHLRHSLYVEIVGWVDGEPQLSFRRE